MNGCGGESIRITVSGVTVMDGGYEHLITEAMKRMSEHLPDAAIHRRRDECDGMSQKDEWFIGCAHSEVSAGGNAITGMITFVRYGSEETAF